VGIGDPKIDEDGEDFGAAAVVVDILLGHHLLTAVFLIVATLIARAGNRVSGLVR
jgi:hypothetical protein